MGDLLGRLGVRAPVVQAGMGGGLDGHELAAAVSAAGGLGTIGMLAPDELRAELAAARRLAGGPLAINLLLPFARRAHFEAAAAAEVLVTFWGKPRRRTANVWLHQCGSLEEAREARSAGADGVILQGEEAGGHVRGALPALELLAQARRELPPGYPLLSAGGVADAGDLRKRLDAGADAVVCGTRFLLSDECAAHPLYKQRLLASRETVLTDLFGLGWHAPHRVVANAATRRWAGEDGHGPSWLGSVQALSAPLLSRAPLRAQQRLASMQSPALPLFGPLAPTRDGPAGLVEAGPLYAGQCIARIGELRPAGQLVHELTRES